VEAFAALSGYLSSRMPEKLAELPSADDGASPDGWHELAVANPTFLLERLGSECTDVQGLRELTVNGLDAIAALGADRNGRVVWDLDWGRFDASGGRVRKLSVIDTGTGMTAGQLRYYINQLAASGREQSLTGNFGVGAKVAAGSRNPQGSSTAPGIRAKARWCASSATPTGAGAWNRSSGQTAAPSGGPIADPPQRHAQAHRLGDARPGGVEQLHPDHRQRHRALGKRLFGDEQPLAVRSRRRDESGGRETTTPQPFQADRRARRSALRSSRPPRSGCCPSRAPRSTGRSPRRRSWSHRWRPIRSRSHSNRRG